MKSSISDYRVLSGGHDVLDLRVKVVRGEFPIVSETFLSEGEFVVMSSVVTEISVALVVPLTHLNSKISSFISIFSCFGLFSPRRRRWSHCRLWLSGFSCDGDQSTETLRSRRDSPACSN